MALEYNGANTWFENSGPELDNIFAGGGSAMGWMYLYAWSSSSSKVCIKAESSDSDSETLNGWGLSAAYYSPTYYEEWRTIYFEHTFSRRGGRWVAPFYTLNLNEWVHIAVVYDNSSKLNDPVLYLNGVSQIVTPYQSPNGTASDDTGFSARWGADKKASNPIVTYGMLADNRLYDRALGAAELQTIASCRGNDGILNGLVTWIPHDTLAPGQSPSGAGSIKDWSISQLNGTPTGSPVFREDPFTHKRRCA